MSKTDDGPPVYAPRRRGVYWAGSRRPGAARDRKRGFAVSERLVYRSYAKINLFLDVLRRRRDGYHNIETVFQTVSLADELTFEAADSGIEVACNRPGLDCGPGNLIHRAAHALREETGCALGVRVRLDKRIPIAAGLAGGSGNAAATLLALDRLWGLDLSPGLLDQLALALGSDVPYCMRGGTMAATRRGEQLAALAPLGGVWFVLVHPDLAVSTAAVYGSPKLMRNNAPAFAGKTAAFREAIRALSAGDYPRAVFNRMEEPVFLEYPELAAIKARLLEAGCLAATMSGSGPTLYGVCATRSEAESTARALAPHRVSVVTTAPVGVERVA